MFHYMTEQQLERAIRGYFGEPARFKLTARKRAEFEQAKHRGYPQQIRPRVKRDFVIAFQLYCPECRLVDFVKVSNLGWQGGLLHRNGLWHKGLSGKQLFEWEGEELR